MVTASFVVISAFKRGDLGQHRGRARKVRFVFPLNAFESLHGSIGPLLDLARDFRANRVANDEENARR